MSETFDYSDAKADADALIAEFGQSATLRRPTNSGDAWNPTEGEPEDHAVTIVVTDYRLADVDGSRVLATDRKALLAKGDLAIEPSTSDQLLIGGVSHSIIDVKPLSPGGTVVLWELQVRR